MKKIFNKNVMLMLLLIIPFFKPVGLSYFRIIDYMFKLWKLISILIITALIIKKILKNRKVNIDINFSGLIIFWLIYLLNCIFNNTNSFAILSNIIVIFLMFEWIKYECETDKGNDLLNSIEILFTIYLIVQFISVFYINIAHKPIFQPIKNDYVYFLGTDNYSAFQIIPMLLVIIYNNYLKRDIVCFKNISLVVISIACNIFTKSYTALFTTILLLIIVILNKRIKKILEILSIKRIVTIYILLMILILGFNIQNIFAELLENQMQKGVTLNSRTIIWKDALELIKAKPIFGYGTLPKEIVDSYALYGVEHAHNMLLDLMLRTGIVGTLAYIAFLTKMVSKKVINSKAFILYAGLLVFFVLSFMDFYPDILNLYLMIGILYNYRRFESKEE